MASVAWRNLFHDKVRLAVTLTGIIFAVVLIGIQAGLFIGFANTIAAIIEHTQMDLWITSKGTRYLESAHPLSEHKIYQVLSTPGVATAKKYIVSFVPDWKRNDGSKETVIIVGFDPSYEACGPWNIVTGRIQELKSVDTVFVDRLFQNKLGITHLNQVIEINNRRAKVIGFTQGIRTFTTAPYVFTWFKNAQNFAKLPENETVYILVKAVSGTDLQILKKRLYARVSDVDIYTTPEFGKKNQCYWLFSTGLGITIMIAAILGLIVGIVVVAQTIYATTVDHFWEFGILRAMGASNRYIYSIIIKQAVISAIMGYIPGIIICLSVSLLSQNQIVVIMLPWKVIIGIFGLTLLMCIVAAITSIKKVMHLDPLVVFKGSFVA